MLKKIIRGGGKGANRTHLGNLVTKTFDFLQRNGILGLKALIECFKMIYKPKYLIEGFSRKLVFIFLPNFRIFSVFDSDISSQIYNYSSNILPFHVKNLLSGRRYDKLNIS